MRKKDGWHQNKPLRKKWVASEQTRNQSKAREKKWVAPVTAPADQLKKWVAPVLPLMEMDFCHATKP
jgi:hypothetical protein